MGAWLSSPLLSTYKAVSGSFKRALDVTINKVNIIIFKLCLVYFYKYFQLQLMEKKMSVFCLISEMKKHYYYYTCFLLQALY